jgi:hypothetical protein
VTSIDPEVKAKMPVTHAIALAIDRFYFNHYCKHFRSGAFARANCSMSVFSRFISVKVAHVVPADP